MNRVSRWAVLLEHAIGFHQVCGKTPRGHHFAITADLLLHNRDLEPFAEYGKQSDDSSSSCVATTTSASMLCLAPATSVELVSDPWQIL